LVEVKENEVAQLSTQLEKDMAYLAYHNPEQLEKELREIHANCSDITSMYRLVQPIYL
jgi:hypothetical protein